MFRRYRKVYYIIMLRLFCIILTVGALETTRVSRIKPPYLNHRPEGSARYPMVGATVIPPSSDTEVRHTTSVSSVVSSPSPVTHLRAHSCDKPYSCVNCTTYRLCAPSGHGYVELFSGSCPGDRPYCDHYSGTCVNSIIAAVQCAEPDKSFRCMRDGHFPHPSDPTKYFICSDLQAYGYSCKEGYKYYAPSQGCSKFSWIVNPFDCSELNATKVLYNNGGSFFAYCVDGRPYLVSSCGENEFFNATSQVCEPQCNKEFIASDSNNCVRYFKCFKNSLTQLYEKISLKCPSGEGFSNSLRKCVPLNQLGNCTLSKIYKNVEN